MAYRPPNSRKSNFATEPDALHTFDRVVTPMFMLRLLADLRAVGSLTPGQVRVMEKAILTCVSADGAWKVIE
jgi:hypothetical protein